jgi:pullulanase
MTSIARFRLAIASLAAIVNLAFGAVFTAWLAASHTPAPTRVVAPGDFQQEIGCAGDWQPDCPNTALSFDATDLVWQGTFPLPAGNWQYKVALNGSWDENYGLGAVPSGTNISLSLPAPRSVKFYYDHATHWITSSANSIIAVVAGSFQNELGCPGDWQPDCLRSWLQDPDGDGIYAFSTRALPPGTYDAKVAISESWDENYGADGAPNGPNIPFTVSAPGRVVTFSYDSTTHALVISEAPFEPQPASVVVAGSFQSELGCPGDWQPDCTTTGLAFDEIDLVWQSTFSIPAGSWEYKAALNGSWDENYGLFAQRNGQNIPLALASSHAVKFYYDHTTHWIADSVTATIATVAGSFQSELGCPGDWQPDCLRSWLQDADGDGIYTFSTRALPPGSYEAKVAIAESWAENYGVDGVRDGANIPFTVATAGAETVFTYNARTHLLAIGAAVAPRGNLTRARAHWVSEETLLWDVPAAENGWSVRLHYAAAGGLALEEHGVSGGITIPLVNDPSGPSAAIREQFPHLASYAAFRIPADHLNEIPSALRSQLAISASSADGTLMDATSLQIPGVLDDLYAYGSQLGVVFDGTTPTLKLWAPTAQTVSLLLYDSSSATSAAVLPMTFDQATGVWSVRGTSDWYGKYYAYRVSVFVWSTGRVEQNVVTDPYSVSLARNSRRSQIISLSDPGLQPAGWLTLRKPLLAAPENIAIYELHIRDFSANDSTVPEAWRGTFKAFTIESSNGMQHLTALARAGLTHVHLLPSFDIATVDEDKLLWLKPEGDLRSFPPDSTEQQTRVMAVADRDGYNWGYDPWHYSVPEGSYATDTDGPARIVEFREMVKGLNQRGLRVVMDVVFNHTTAAGQSDRSVLDRIVPGYYHRLDADGNIETSSCCPNTATEHAMMEKLMIDSVLLWATQYKVDGFRFDLMGHHMRRNMVRLRQQLDSLTAQRDGIDGRKIYVYGEGWNFGEVADNARGVNATQINMTGTGIGTFNDRLRDGTRGGGPFSGLQEQGFLTGLLVDPNATDQGSRDEQLTRLLRYTDWIKVGLAGNLAAFRLVNQFGALVRASEIDYNGQPAGYTADPQEAISYVEAHDNETLFDATQLKAPIGTSMADRVRMQNLGLSLLALGQGVPFFHAGTDMLRSKSLDRNSYNSGDWFNALDFTYQSNNWAVGLPPARDNASNWPLMGPLLVNPALRPAPGDIHAALDHLREMLEIRRSSPLFRLRTTNEVVDHMTFYNGGPSQVPGLIVMELTDDAGAIDRRYQRIVVLFNATTTEQRFALASEARRPFVLHPTQMASADAIVRNASFDRRTGTFSVPARTTAVLVLPR